MEICGQPEANFKLYKGLWCIGVIASLIASSGATFGIILQKLAHNENEALHPQDRLPIKCGILCSSRWISGFILLAIFPIIFEAIAYTFAPQSLISPLGGLTIIINQLAAPPFLGEKVSTRDWQATGILFLGIVICAIFAPHVQADINVDNIELFYASKSFLSAETCCLGLIFAALCFAELRSNSIFVPICHAWIAAGFGAQQNIAFKATGMMVFSALADGKSITSTPNVAMFFCLLVISAFLQLAFLNKGLSMHNAVLFLPLYSGLLIVCSTIMGAIFYQEIKCFSTLDGVMFISGLIVITLGCLMLTMHRKSEEKLETKQGLLKGDRRTIHIPTFRRQGSTEGGLSHSPSIAHHLLSTPLTPTILKPGTPQVGSH